MIGLIQRVRSAKVEVHSEIISQIDKGLLLFLGIEKNDTETNAEMLADKIAKLRIFADENDKMNQSLRDISGKLLVVSQFTLAADLNKGNRPGFSNSAPPELGEALYAYFIKYFQQHYGDCQQGKFGADMQVSLVNDGPATFYISN